MRGAKRAESDLVQQLIAQQPALVQDLVNHVLGAGQWLDAEPANRDKAVAIAAGRKFFNQDPKILDFVMRNPSDRVTYGDLRMIRDEFVFGTRVPTTSPTAPLSYEAASFDPAAASLSVRAREADPPQPIPASQWHFTSSRAIVLPNAGWVSG